MPSQQHSRMQRDLSYDYISAVGVSRAGGNQVLQSNNSSKIENYKRIKQEEAQARAQLMAPQARVMGEPLSSQKVRHSELNQIAAHRRNPSLLGQKYKPSENALASYSPLRSQLSH